MKQTDPQLKLRLPHKLMEQIREAAGSGRRTLSAEIIGRLEQTFADEVHLSSAPSKSLDMRLAELEQEVQTGLAPIDYLQQEMTDVLLRLAALEKAVPRRGQ